MTKYNVCFLGGTRYSQRLDATGAKKFRALASLGELFVVGFSQDWRPRSFAEHARFYLLPQIPVPILRYGAMFTLGLFLTLWCILRYKVSVLVAQSPYEGFAGAGAKILARIFGKRVALIVESHGDFEISLFLQRHLSFPRFYRLLMQLAARFALYHADALRCVSNSTRKQLEAWAPGRPILQFPTWTDTEVFLERGAVRQRNGAQGEGKIVLYAGVLIPRKGVHFLLDAFAQIADVLPDARLLLIGKAENREYAEALRGQVARLGLNQRVSFLDKMPQHWLAAQMAQADVLVLPTLSEGLPRVVFEAMAAQTPVIASAVSGIPEIIEDGVTGLLVPPGDPTALAGSLRWVLQHPREAHDMAQRAAGVARILFSQASYVQNYGRLFQLATQLLDAYEQ